MWDCQYQLSFHIKFEFRASFKNSFSQLSKFNKVFLTEYKKLSDLKPQGNKVYLNSQQLTDQFLSDVIFAIGFVFLARYRYGADIERFQSCIWYLPGIPQLCWLHIRYRDWDPRSVWNLDKLPHAGSYLLLINDKNFTQLVWLVWLRKSFIFLIIYKAPSQAAPHFLPSPPVGNYFRLRTGEGGGGHDIYNAMQPLFATSGAWPWTLNWGAQRCWIFNIYCFQQEI